MLKTIIIADTSSLIALKNIGELSLLQKVYKQIIITPEVAEEFGEDLPDWVNIQFVNDKKKIKLLELELDRGESSAIALAMEAEDSLLVIDERKGREIAKRMGLKITGLLGVIIKAKQNGIIDKVKPIINKLEFAGFRMSQKLKQQILIKIDEID